MISTQIKAYQQQYPLSYSERGYCAFIILVDITNMVFSVIIQQVIMPI